MSTFHYDPPREPFLDILFEDEHIIVVNKPSGILSVPGKAVEHFDSIASRVKSRYPQGGAVHRLDMGTSGVLVVVVVWCAPCPWAACVCVCEALIYSTPIR